MRVGAAKNYFNRTTRGALTLQLLLEDLERTI